MKILIIEDDSTFGEILKRALEREGYFVELINDGEKGIYRSKTGNFSLILLDIKLPGKNGFEICRELRHSGKTVPILMITAVSEEFGAAAGLDLGADDYLRKPFDLAELFARVRALLRRKQGQKKTFLEYGPLSIDFCARRIFYQNEEIRLNPKEYKLLSYLAHHQGHAVSFEELAENVWGEELVNINSNSMEVYVHRLRKLLQKYNLADKLVTIRGHGYQLLNLE